MKPGNQRGKSILGLVFIALALVLYGLSFYQQPKLEPIRKQLQRLHVEPQLIKGIVHQPSLLKIISNTPAAFFLLVGIAWAAQNRKTVGTWAYGILGSYFGLLSVLLFIGSSQAKPKSPILISASILLVLGALFIWITRRRVERGALPDVKLPAAKAAAAIAAPESAGPAPKPVAKSNVKRWHSCNVLNTNLDKNQLWQFELSGNRLKLDREQVLPASQPLPPLMVNKSWRSLWQPRLNVAWLPAESVFLRVVQLPKSSPEETLSMLELQLEKLSPIPVTQIVWSASLLTAPPESTLQTLIVVLAERKSVEAFLGQLEGQGYLADRLELPVLDQLEAAEVRKDGAWIYPGAWSGPNNALVAWWYGGTLQNINFITLPEGEDRFAGFREQLTQMAWAGELEGWLTRPPAWHLVADAATAAEWEQSLRQRLGEPVETFLALSPVELAARTAKRAASPAATTSLMPPEFATRYQQQFVDRLWLHALLAAGGAWILFVVIYMVAAQFLDIHTKKIEQKVAATSLVYTNTIELKAKLAVLREREELKYAALDCWQAVAESLPEIVTLEGLSFSDGHRVTLNGTAPKDESAKVTDFNVALRKRTVNGAPLFDTSSVETPSINLTPSSPTLTWRFGFELKRSETE